MRLLDWSWSQLYFMPIDRDSGLEGAVAHLIGGSVADTVVEGPLTETPPDFASQWTVDWSAGSSWSPRHADGEREPLPALSARGAISGVPGAWYLVTEPGQPDARAYALEASPLTGGSVQTLVEVGAQDPTQATLRIGPDHGASVPAGWVLRWPTEGSRYTDISVPPHVWYSGELVNVVTGERLAVQPTNWPDTPTECAPIAPATLPSGALPGEPITTPGGHYLWTTWGEDEDQVVQVVGGWLFGVLEPGESGEFGGKVTVRGHPGRVMQMGSVEGPWAIAWEEDGCRYEVQLAPGGTQAEAVAYAGRYSAPTPTADDERLVDAIIKFARSPSPVGREAVPFADDGVWLGLAEQLLTRRSPAELVEPAAWELETEAFRGHVGPFSALDRLAMEGETTVSMGPHPHCASPPVPPPDEMADARRLSIQPVGIDACLRWWTVDLFLTPNGEVQAVTLDLWEP